MTLTRLVDLQGEAGDFRALLAQRPRYVEVERCTGCGECTRVCPRSWPDPYNLGLSSTKAIHVPYLQAVPQAANIEPEACRLFQGKPCEACLKVCTPGAIAVHQQPELRERAAGAVILATGTLTALTGEFDGVSHPDVVTSLQFERLLSATGPQGGKLLRPSDSAEPRTLAFHPELVLLELEQDGTVDAEWVRQIRRCSPHATLIGLADDEFAPVCRVRAHDCGIDYCVPISPFDHTELVGIVNSLQPKRKHH